MYYALAFGVISKVVNVKWIGVVSVDFVLENFTLWYYLHATNYRNFYTSVVNCKISRVEIPEQISA